MSEFAENDSLLETLILAFPVRAGATRADRARDVLPTVQALMARAWDAGHATDEHGPGLCECPNPYRVTLPANP